MERIVEVFTAKTVEQMLDLGGSQSWVLNPQSMRGVRFLVCVRNDDPQYDEECGQRPEPRNSAFMVGKVRGLKKVERRNDRDRYLVLFSEYAVLDKPVLGFRNGSTRNPVLYSDTEHSLARGLDIGALDFKPMPEAAEVSGNATVNRKGLTIAEAKEGLSIHYGVSIENVSITISG